MKRTASLLAFLSGLIAIEAGAGNSMPLPTPFPETRYLQMSSRSPFAIATASAPASAAATPGFAAQLYLDGMAHVGQSDFVAIKSRDPENPRALFVEVGKSTLDGIRVDRVRWSSEMGKSTADVSKGGETVTLSFDQAQLAQNLAASQQMQSSQPGIPPQGQMGPPGSPMNPGRPGGYPPLPRRVLDMIRQRRMRTGQ
jgi:hypothetical protein